MYGCLAVAFSYWCKGNRLSQQTARTKSTSGVPEKPFQQVQFRRRAAQGVVGQNPVSQDVQVLLVFGGLFGGVDDENVEGRGGGFELEA